MEKKEAMKILKDFHDKSALFSVRTALDTIIPELCESEDERIRKELIDAINGLWDNDALPMPLSVKRKDAWIAWLEKQKEYESTDFEYVWDRTDCGDLTSALDKYSEEAIINMCHAWYDKGIELERKSWLEKQGNTFSKKDIDDAYLKGICNTKHELEKQGERKSTDKPKFEIGDEIKTDNEVPLIITKIDEQGYWSGDLFICSFEDSAKWELVGKIIDKVEPKFHEGEWITNGDYTWKIAEVKPLDYILQSQDGNIVDDTISHVDEQFHLWTIKDAKDGDIVVVPSIEGSEHSEQIFIFKEIKNRDYIKNAVEYYCRVFDNEFCMNERGFMGQSDDYFVPATQEQQDLLFQKMKETGYKWDEDTHELKKISQRMVSAEAKEALYDKPTDEEMKELLRTEYEKGRADTIAEMYVPTQISPEESLGVSSEKYMDIVDTLTQGGQKPAKWSLEDERVIAIINNALTESNTPPDDYDKVYDWLESLRKRIGE